LSAARSIDDHGAMLWGKRTKRAMPDLKWPEFEALVGEGFRQHGFLVIESGTDLVLEKAGQTFLARCRHWRDAKVDLGPVREMQAAIGAKSAAGGFILTAGEFTAAATEYAKGCGIRLLNGARLGAMLEKARQTVTLPLRIEPRLGTGQPSKI
jgi:restriction system protein